MKKGMNTFIGLIDKYLFLCFNLIKNKYMKLLELILDWKMALFGLIFLGSIFNAIAFELGILENNINFSYACYAFGLLLGLIAKFRQTWTWTSKTIK